jgi:chondroitin AC lyase
LIEGSIFFQSNSVMAILSFRFLLLVCLFAAPRTGVSADFDVIEARLTTAFLAGKPKAAAVNSLVAALSAEGRWNDIDYADRSLTPWAPDTHLDRMLEIAKAYADPTHSLRGSPALQSALTRSFDGWVAANPQSVNWWYNEISVPQLLGKTLLLARDALGESRVSTGLGIVARAYRPRTSTSGTNTGANRIDRAVATLVRGVIARDSNLTSESFLAVGDTLAPTMAEGIQVDGSFHQHGPQPHSGSYGLVFAEVTAATAGYGAGTAFGLSEGNVRVLVDFLLDGQQWFIRGRSFDATMMGRSISRPSATNIGLDLIEPTAALLQVTDYRKAELVALQNRLSAAKSLGIANPAVALTGNKHFWRSDITAHHRPAFSTSVKISSTRTREPEMANGEGLQSLHLADGVNLVLRRGDEYDGIAPVWDWRRLPGTTIEQANYSLAPTGTLGVQGTSRFAGGVSNGFSGATAFDYGRRNVTAHKSWFFFDDEYVALGADIDALAATAPVITTLNQVFRRSTISWGTSSATAGTLTNGTVTRDDIRWVHHDSIGYILPAAADTVTIKGAIQTGSWSAINSTKSATPVTGDVFSLQIDHGLKPTDASYAYIVLPGASAGTTAAYAAAPRVRVLANERSLQAVRHDGMGLSQAVFFEPGHLVARSGLSLTVRSPAAVMLAERTQGMTLSAANPAGTALTLRADIHHDLPDGAGDFARVTLRLPGGDHAGATVSRILDRPAQPTHVATFREMAATTAGLLHQWTFEGDRQEDRLTAAVGSIGLVPRAYGTEATTADIAYGPGLDATTTAMSPLRLGRLADSAGGAALATTGPVSLPTSFTIEALVRPDHLEAGGVTGFAVMAGGWRTGTRGYFLAQQEGTTTDALATIVGDSLTQPDNVATILPGLDPSHWYYVASTYTIADSQTTVRSYLADVTAGEQVVRVAVLDQVASGTPPTSAVFGIGGLFTDGILQEAWSGSIDEVSVYGRALATTEIQDRLASLYTPPPRLTWVADDDLPGGDGTWTAPGRQWQYGTSRVGWSDNSAAVFSGSGGIVTIDGTVTVNRGLEFTADGFTLTTGSLALSGPDVSIAVEDHARAVLENSLSGSRGFTKTGSGELVLARGNTISGTTTVADGRLLLAHASALAASPVLVIDGGELALVAGLSTSLPGLILQGGRVDVGTGRLTIAVGGVSEADLLASLRLGRNGGDWSGAEGITSSAADPQGHRGVGYSMIGSDSAVIAWAAPGDCNLDGQVDIFDAGLMLGGGAFNSERPATWAQGDFSYDGAFNTFDLVMVLAADVFGRGSYRTLNSVGPLAPGGDVAVVPEPRALMLAAGGILSCLGWIRAVRNRIASDDAFHGPSRGRRLGHRFPLV